MAVAEVRSCNVAGDWIWQVLHCVPIPRVNALLLSDCTNMDTF